jgi:hypothetical protein
MHDEDNDGRFPDESPVEVRYPRSKQECGGLFGGPLIAVHAQHVKSGLNESFGRLPVEMGLSMAAARRQLKAVVRAAGGEPLGLWFPGRLPGSRRGRAGPPRR